MLRLTEVASQSVTFVKPALRKAKTNTLNSINEMDGPSGHYLVVFSLDRPPLLAIRRRHQSRDIISFARANVHIGKFGEVGFRQRELDVDSMPFIFGHRSRW